MACKDDRRMQNRSHLSAVFLWLLTPDFSLPGFDSQSWAIHYNGARTVARGINEDGKYKD